MEEVRTSSGQLISSGSIILNREKLNSIKEKNLLSEPSAPYFFYFFKIFELVKIK